MAALNVFWPRWKVTSVASLALISDDAAAYRTEKAKDVCPYQLLLYMGLYSYYII